MLCCAIAVVGSLLAFDVHDRKNFQVGSEYKKLFSVEKSQFLLFTIACMQIAAVMVQVDNNFNVVYIMTKMVKNNKDYFFHPEFSWRSLPSPADAAVSIGI
mmetsp:Transcript_12429/g.29139  ORF Transcript_12429/g.29139 Transcript_12429/m.29139 type:complete len:101 (-) Transcript_12429:891-1193(-)